MNFPIIPFVAPRHYPPTDEWLACLRAALPGETIVAFDQLSERDKAAATLAIVANPDPTDLRQLPRLIWVHSVWAGVERLIADLGDRARASDTSLHIVRLVDPQLTDTMAEAVLAWTLYLHRDMPAYARQQREKRWHERPYVRPQQRTVALLGLGVLGSESARRLLAAGFKVCGWSRERKSLPGVTCFAGDEALGTMLAQSDILVCLLPLTRETRGLLNAARLARLPRGASLINFARGPIVDDDALRAALNSGQLDHAVLDVFAVEPLPPGEWQWTHPRVTVLPHCSGVTNTETASRIVAGAIQRYRLSGELPARIDVTRGY